jgi:hypothetical protein
MDEKNREDQVTLPNRRSADLGFDGSKVWRWNKGIYALLIAIAAIMAF